MSIALTTSTVVTINGATVETDSTAEAVSLSVNFLTGMLSVVFNSGTLNGSTFTPGEYGPLVTLYINLATGAWYTLTQGNGVVNETGTVAESALASVISQLAGMRNLAETFAAGTNNVLPGVTTAYSSTSV